MHFISVDDYSDIGVGRKEPKKVYLNIDAVTKVLFTPESHGYYIIKTGGEENTFVNKEDCQRILEEIKRRQN